ncbi:MAG TPA: hypothetical protein VLV83_26075 [Acidobacteriota bacterium]|nr:hypothetical protein [Acidobacteriota bacterium]
MRILSINESYPEPHAQPRMGGFGLGNIDTALRTPEDPIRGSYEIWVSDAQPGDTAFLVMTPRKAKPDVRTNIAFPDGQTALRVRVESIPAESETPGRVLGATGVLRFSDDETTPAHLGLAPGDKVDFWLAGDRAQSLIGGVEVVEEYPSKTHGPGRVHPGGGVTPGAPIKDRVRSARSLLQEAIELLGEE